MREMGEGVGIEEFDEGRDITSALGSGENIKYIESSNEWSTFQNDLADIIIFLEYENA